MIMFAYGSLQCISILFLQKEKVAKPLLFLIVIDEMLGRILLHTKAYLYIIKIM